MYDGMALESGPSGLFLPLPPVSCAYERHASDFKDANGGDAATAAPAADQAATMTVAGKKVTVEKRCGMDQLTATDR